MPVPVEARASVDVYAPGHGEYVMSDRGFGHNFIMAQAYKGATFEGFQGPLPNLEYTPELGLLCRPIIVPQDNLTSQYALTPSTVWDHVRPTSGGYRVSYLRMFSASYTGEYLATHNTSFQANGNLAFSLNVRESPSGWDYALFGDPFIRVELGGGAWGIHLGQKAGAHLLANLDGTLRSVLQLNEPSRASGAEEQDQIWILVRWAWGKIGISFDYGRTYQTFGDQVSPAFIPAGPVAFRGRGHQAAFGVHQIKLNTGSILPRGRDAFYGRPIVTPEILGYEQEPNGSLVTYDDASTDTHRNMRPKVTLAPGIVPGYPWAQYFSPSVQQVIMRYPYARQATGSDVTQPWDPYLIAIDVDKPWDLGDLGITIRLRQDAFSLFQDDHRMRKLRVRLGYYNDDATTTWFDFICYVTSVAKVWDDEFGSTMVTVQAGGAVEWFRQAEWTMMDEVPLDDMFMLDAADYVLISEGWMDEARTDLTRRIWSTTNGALLRRVPRGAPDDPYLPIVRRQKKIETLERIFDCLGMELGADDDGRLISLPKGYVDNDVSFTYRSTPVGSIGMVDQVDEIENEFDAFETGTIVLAYGILPSGEELAYVIRDLAAETNALSGRYSPIRMPVQIDLGEGVDGPSLMQAAQSGASTTFGMHHAVNVTAPIHLGLGRRLRVDFQGFVGVGIPNGTQCRMMAVRHEYRNRVGLRSMKTRTSLRRIT